MSANAGLEYQNHLTSADILPNSKFQSLIEALELTITISDSSSIKLELKIKQN
jgi:hypothetical protein